MGPRRPGKKKSSSKKGVSANSRKQSDELTVVQLIEKTQELMDDNQYDIALKYAAKAIEKDDKNTKALLLAAIIQLEVGDVDPALNCLLRCAEIEPDKGFEKYMYLGQFAVELEAVKYFQLGVEAMKRDLEDLSKDTIDQSQAHVNAAGIKRKMAEAYVAMTEIYLTDCCYEPDAEQKCEMFLEEASKVDPQCAEVYQTLASVRLSQNRVDDARECLEKSMSLWIGNGKYDSNSDTQIPSFDNRLALVRLLLEVDQKENAFNLLEMMQKEDEDNVDLWYLYGWTYHLQSDETSDVEEKAELLGSARDCFEKAIKMANLQEYEDKSLTSHAMELIKEINKIVPMDKDGGSDEDDETMGPNEEDWEDIESDDDDNGDSMDTHS